MAGIKESRRVKLLLLHGFALLTLALLLSTSVGRWSTSMPLDVPWECC